MTVFLVLLIPLLLMVFALLMERVENRLRTTSVTEDEVEEFLDQAEPEEVNTFIREGWGRALAVFRLRRTPRGRRSRVPSAAASTRLGEPPDAERSPVSAGPISSTQPPDPGE